MIVLFIVIPLMLLGIIIATVPVLLGSIRHHRAMRAGQIETTESARYEADFWHRMLGHGDRRDRGVAATPELVSDEEVVRAGVPPEARHTVDGKSVWSTPQ